MSLRLGLDLLYRLGAVAGGICLCAIPLLVLAQAGSRWVALPLTGLSEIASYAMAGTFFLPLGYAFRHGAHVRVSLLLDRTAGEGRWLLELWCLAAGCALTAYLAWYLVDMTYVSWLINDVSQGGDATPLWIPQSAMAAGAAILALACLDSFACHLAARARPVETSPVAIREAA